MFAIGDSSDVRKPVQAGEKGGSRNCFICVFSLDGWQPFDRIEGCGMRLWTFTAEVSAVTVV